MATRARERLLATAEDLFYAEGTRAVGVERLLEESGVGRASFYRHFDGKGDLALTVLRERETLWREWLREEVEARGGHPLAVFDALAERFASSAFRGCRFINAMVEETDPDSAVYALVNTHKEAVTDYVAGLLRAAGHRRPRRLARRLVLLMDGAQVTALRDPSASPAREAKAIAALLLDADLRPDA